MERKLVNVAIANAFYEEKKNLLDTYFPFVLKSFAEKEICTLKDISDKIKKLFDFELPVNSIKNILTKNNVIFQTNKNSKSDWEISLSKEGKIELNKLISEEEKVEKRIIYFYSFFAEFANKTFKTSYTQDNVIPLVNDFFQANLLKISLEKISENGSSQDIDGFEKHFIYFLAFININKPDLVEIFEIIWKGSIIWNELKKESFEETDIRLKKHLDIYIDTNFAISLLKLHNPIINQAAKELYELINGIPNINLYILDVTIREIHSLLDLYDIIKDNFSDIEVDSVFYYLKQQGFSTIKAERLRDNLENELGKLGIAKVETELLRESDQKLYASIYDYLYEKRNIKNENRPDKAKKLESALEKSAHHDTSVIIHVLRHKDKYARSLEASKSLFLTSSYNLYKNYGKLSKKFESLPCVILDTTLTNILYLKNPQKSTKISLTQIIKTHCNYLIVDQSIWNTYLTVLNELKNDKEISIEDYSRLVTKNQTTQEYLLSVDLEKINKKEVKNVLEKIKQKDQELDKTLNEKETLINELTESNKNLIESIKIEREQRQKNELENEKNLIGEKNEFQKQIDKLKYESDLKDYIAERMDEEFYPLSRKLFIFIVVCIICVFCYFFSDYIVTDEFIKAYEVPVFWAYIIRSIITIIIFFVSGFVLNFYNVNFMKFLRNKAQLKKDLKLKYIEEFKKKN